MKNLKPSWHNCRTEKRISNYKCCVWQSRCNRYLRQLNPEYSTHIQYNNLFSNNQRRKIYSCLVPWKHFLLSIISFLMDYKVRMFTKPYKKYKIWLCNLIFIICWTNYMLLKMCPTVRNAMQNFRWLYVILWFLNSQYLVCLIVLFWLSLNNFKQLIVRILLCNYYKKVHKLWWNLYVMKNLTILLFALLSSCFYSDCLVLNQYNLNLNFYFSHNSVRFKRMLYVVRVLKYNYHFNHYLTKRPKSMFKSNQYHVLLASRSFLLENDFFQYNYI